MSVAVGEELPCQRKGANSEDLFAVAVMTVSYRRSQNFPQFVRCIVRGVLYYPSSMILGQIFCRFTGSAAQTHCARRPQLVSNKISEEEIFAGTNFCELAFDGENFPLYGLTNSCSVNYKLHADESATANHDRQG